MSFRLAVCKCTRKIREESADKTLKPPFCNKCNEQMHFLKYWYFDEVRFVRGRRTHTVKCSKSTDRRVANQMERDAITNADNRIPYGMVPKDKKLFNAVIDDYLKWAEKRVDDERDEGPSKSTLETSYKIHIERHIRPFFGWRKTTEIDSEIVEEYIEKRRGEKKLLRVRSNGPYFEKHKVKPLYKDDKGWSLVEGEGFISKSTIDRELTTLSAICTYAVDKKKYMTTHPLKGVKLFHPNNKRVIFLDEIEQIDALLAECKLMPYPHLYRAATIALFTGLRKSDCLSLKRPNIDLKGNQISKTTIKTESDVYIPLFPKFRRELEVWLKEPISISGYLLPTLKDATKCKKSDDDMSFHDVCLRVIDKHPEWPEEWKDLFRKLRFHDLRHTFATQYLYWEGKRSNLSYALFHVSEVLGHSGTEITKRYAHVISRIRNAGAASFVSYFDEEQTMEEMAQ